MSQDAVAYITSNVGPLLEVAPVAVGYVTSSLNSGLVATKNGTAYIYADVGVLTNTWSDK